MAQIKITLPRLRLIRARQIPDRWGANYVASTWATPVEAPSISIASQLTPAKLGGRDFHCLSKPEASASLLALYNPNVWDLHEQKMMSVTARPHYLYGHEMCVGMQFPVLQGTVDVADRMGMLSKHPKVTMRKPESPGEVLSVPFPYIGDLLLFAQDDRGPYLVNWPIKDKKENFRRQGPRPFGQPRSHGDDETAIRRQLLEATYFADGGIRTQQVAGEDIDPVLDRNLQRLFLDHRRNVSADDETQSRLLEFYRSAIGADIKIHDVLREGAGRFSLSEEDAKNILHQGIWERKIRVDLFRILLTDKPLRAEIEDVLVRYSAWFAR